MSTVLLAADVDVAGPVNVVADGRPHLLGEGIGLIEAVAVDLHIDSGRGSAHEAGDTALEVDNLRIGGQFLTQHLGYLEDGAVTLVLLVADHGHGHGVVHGGGEHGRDTVVVRSTGGCGYQLYLGYQLVETALDVAGHLGCLLNTVAGSQLYVHCQTAVVGLLNEVRTDLAHEERHDGRYEEQRYRN